MYIPGDKYQINKSQYALAHANATKQNQPVDTFDVMGATASELWNGAGSYKGFLRAMYIKGADDSGRSGVVSKDQWTPNYEHYRPEIEWYEGMSEIAAAELADDRDRRQANAAILSKADNLQLATGVVGGLAAGIVEPLNLASGVSAALLTKGAATVFPSLKHYSSLLTTARSAKGLAKPAAVEGLISAGMIEPFARYSAKQVQEDYTAADTIMNLATSTALSAGIAAIPPSLRRAVMRPDEKAMFDLVEKINTENMNTAIAQAVEGKPIDVEGASSLAVLEEKNKMQTQRQILQEQQQSLQSEVESINAEAAQASVQLPQLERAALLAEYDIRPEFIPDDIDPMSVYFALREIDEGISSRPDANNDNGGGVNLLGFIRKMGGIRDEGGELAAIGITRRTYPGLINNKSGKSFDEMAEAVSEPGGVFLEGREGFSQDDFLEMLAEYHKSYKGNRRQSLIPPEEYLAQYGIDPAPFLEAKKTQGDAVREIQQEIERAKQAMGSDDRLARKQRQIEDIDRRLRQMPADEELAGRAAKALRESVAETSTAYDNTDFPEFDDAYLSRYSDIEKQKLEEIDAMLNELKAEEQGLPEDYIIAGRDYELDERGIDAISLCLSGR